MDRRTRAAVWWLGAAQCVSWGVLYYGFPVWQVPLQAQLGVPMAVVAAAYSAALLVAAVSAPRVGRGFDRGRGPLLLRIGLLAAVVGLVMLAHARSVLVLFLAWLAIGLGMALTLYESAFALVQQAITAPAPRLRALAAVTVMGGLASTLFLPLTGSLLGLLDLRAALLAGAVAVLAAGWIVERWVLPGLPPMLAETISPAATTIHPRRPIAALAIVFTAGTVAGMAVVTLLVPLLVSRGADLAEAAMVLAALGIAQLPGRLWLLRGGRLPSAAVLTMWPMALQAAGLLVVAGAGSPVLAAAGVALFGLGAGLHTLARPWLVQERFGAEAGYRNGQVARLQGLGRALGPVAAVAAAMLVGSQWVLVALAGLLLVLLPLARSVSGSRPLAPQAFARFSRWLRPSPRAAAGDPSRR